MSNGEILQKAIHKAIDGGWKPKRPEMTLPKPVTIKGTYIGYEPDRKAYRRRNARANRGRSNDDPLDIQMPPNESGYSRSINDIIFNHDFAEALWGDRFIKPEMRDDKGSKVIAIQQTAWKHHLRQMVIADDPIKYLGENI